MTRHSQPTGEEKMKSNNIIVDGGARARAGVGATLPHFKLAPYSAISGQVAQGSHVTRSGLDTLCRVDRW